jgi:hypothetical protein
MQCSPNNDKVTKLRKKELAGNVAYREVSEIL